MPSNNVGQFITKTITTLQHFATLHHTSLNYKSYMWSHISISALNSFSLELWSSTSGRTHQNKALGLPYSDVDDRTTESIRNCGDITVSLIHCQGCWHILHQVCAQVTDTQRSAGTELKLSYVRHSVTKFAFRKQGPNVRASA